MVLTADGVRVSVRTLLEPELPDLPVLSYAELRPDVTVQALAQISVAASPPPADGDGGKVTSQAPSASSTR